VKGLSSRTVLGRQKEDPAAPLEREKRKKPRLLPKNESKEENRPTSAQERKRTPVSLNGGRRAPIKRLEPLLTREGKGKKIRLRRWLDRRKGKKGSDPRYEWGPGRGR